MYFPLTDGPNALQSLFNFSKPVLFELLLLYKVGLSRNKHRRKIASDLLAQNRSKNCVRSSVQLYLVCLWKALFYM